MKRKKIIIILAIILALGAFAIYFYLGTQAVDVEQVTVKPLTIAKTVSASGVMKSRNQADLSFASGGKITSINVQKGDTVVKNQLLATVYLVPFIETSQSLKDARDIALRDRDLFIELNKEAEQNEEYKINLRRLDEFVSRAEATYQSQLAGTNNLYLTAPFAGTIVDVFAKQGEIAMAGSPLLKIADLKNLYMEIELDQEDFGKLQTGQKVQVELDAYEEIAYQGRVSALPQYAQTDSFGDEIFIIEIDIEQKPEYPALLSMTGNVDITLQEIYAKQSVPFDIIVSDTTGNYIWVAENGVLKKEYVEIGLEGDLDTEIISDLNGKILVRNGSKKDFSEGLKVKINDK